MFEYLLKDFANNNDIIALNSHLTDVEPFIASVTFLVENDTHLTSEQRSAILAVTLVNAPQKRELREFFSYLMAKRQFRHLEIRDAIKIITTKTLGHSYTSTMKKMVLNYLHSLDETNFSLYLTEGTPAMRYIADLTHPSPRNFQQDWMLSAIFGADAPQNSVLATLMAVSTPTDYMRLPSDLRKTSFTYFIRKFVKSNINFQNYDAFCMDLITSTPLARIIRGINEYDYKWLATTKYIEKLVDRINHTNFIHLNVGEIIYYSFKQDSAFAESLYNLGMRILTKQGKSDIFNNVTMVIDRSGSMDPVISGGIILSTMLKNMAVNPNTVTTIFFDDSAEISESNITTAAELKSFIKENYSRGSTSPAAAVPLIPQNSKFIILLTDEGENVAWKNLAFHEALKKYLPEIPIIIIGRSGNGTKMTDSLQSINIYPTIIPIGVKSDEIVRNIESIISLMIKRDDITELRREYFVERLSTELKNHSFSEVINKIDFNTCKNALKSFQYKLNSEISLGSTLTILYDLQLLFKDYEINKSISAQYELFHSYPRDSNLTREAKQLLKVSVEDWITFTESQNAVNELDKAFIKWEETSKDSISKL